MKLTMCTRTWKRDNTTNEIDIREAVDCIRRRECKGGKPLLRPRRLSEIEADLRQGKQLETPLAWWTLKGLRAV